MSSLQNKIREEASRLKDYLDIDTTITSKFNDIVSEVAKSWSQSNLGYHHCVYYKNFEKPPHEAYFSQEWGLKNEYAYLGLGSQGEWVEYEYDSIIKFINKEAGDPDLSELKTLSADAKRVILEVKDKILSLIHFYIQVSDPYLKEKTEIVESIYILTGKDVWINQIRGMKVASREENISKEFKMSPHEAVVYDCLELTIPFDVAKRLYDVSIKIAEHLDNDDNLILSKRLIREEKKGDSMNISFNGNNNRLNSNTTDNSNNTVNINNELSQSIEALKSEIHRLNLPDQEEKDAIEVIGAIEKECKNNKCKVVVKALIKSLPTVASIANIGSSIISLL